ncbi:MAG: IS30 family transposase [Chloroflexi bacterium]|jgi:IS30 family transposase|nr:IS30 family transposase [Chloroflexota bacterium]
MHGHELPRWVLALRHPAQGVATQLSGSVPVSISQRLARERRTAANEQRDKLRPGGALGQYIRAKLRQRWSPEQIVGRLKRDRPRNSPRDPAMRVTHETIYRWVYAQHQSGGRWHEQLRRRHKRRRCRIVGERTGSGRGQIPGRVGIEQRPAVVDRRGRFGDWEADTVEGAKGTGLIATHVERKSRYTKLGKLKDKKAATLSRNTCALFRGLPKKLRRTSTFDNGKGVRRVQTHPGHAGHGHLLRQPPRPLGTRGQRKHQRPAPRLIPQRQRL